MKSIFLFLIMLLLSLSFLFAQESELIDIDMGNIDSIFGEPLDDTTEKQPSAQQPAAQRPTTQQPAAQQPTTQQPAAQQPTTQQPTAQQPAAQQPAAQQPATQQPAAQQPAARQPAAQQPAAQQPAQQTPARTAASNIRRRGIEFTASYQFRGAINPGWEEYPWEAENEDNFTWALSVLMRSTLGINAQVTNNLRFRSDLRFQVPAMSASYNTTTTTTNPNTGVVTVRETETTYYPLMSLQDFFLDYNFSDTVFLRAGKFSQTWGVSRNFRFANLLARLPDRKYLEQSANGPSYIIRFEIPIGVGGLQLLAMTRVNILSGGIPYRDYIGYGGKYNLAFNWADLNFGFYYQSFMPLRGFASVKTTLFKTDLYNEWLVAYNLDTDESVDFACSIGLTRTFFSNNFETNLEYFYNGEDVTNYFRAETDFRVEGTDRLPIGSSLALNLLYRFSGKMNPRAFIRMRYSATEDAINLVPGFRFTPFANINVYFAVPVTFGNKDSYFFEDSKNVRGEIRPMSFLLYINFSGTARASFYY